LPATSGQHPGNAIRAQRQAWKSSASPNTDARLPGIRSDHPWPKPVSSNQGLNLFKHGEEKQIFLAIQFRQNARGGRQSNLRCHLCPAQEGSAVTRPVCQPSLFPPPGVFRIAEMVIQSCLARRPFLGHGR
jgi:hypothetical protein